MSKLEYISYTMAKSLLTQEQPGGTLNWFSDKVCFSIECENMVHRQGVKKLYFKSGELRSMQYS